MKASIDRFFVGREARLKAAMQQLEETEERIVFVLDADGCLFGALSDGDIRRWILADGPLDTVVENVCNRTPFAAPSGYAIEELQAVMSQRNIPCVPVVDADGRPLDLLFARHVFPDTAAAVPRPERLDVPVVVMAGGKGTRLDPFTRILPKPLIPVGEKAVIEVIIESFTRHGLRDFTLSINHKARLIRSYFEELNPDYELKYLEEVEPRGTIGALHGFTGSRRSPLIVTNCDILIRADYADLVRSHEQAGNDITIVASMRTYNVPYGVCELGAGGRLRRIVEKPQYDLLVNTGMYVLGAGVLDLIPPAGIYHATDLIAAVMSRGGAVGVYPISEKAWLDTGEWAQYRQTLRAVGADGTGSGTWAAERRITDRGDR